MSSARKDARWLLMTRMREAAGYDDLLPWVLVTQLLAVADSILDLQIDRIQSLADEWNEPD